MKSVYAGGVFDDVRDFRVEARIAGFVSKPLDTGFRLGEFTVFPLRNLVESPDGEQHLEPKAIEVLL